MKEEEVDRGMKEEEVGHGSEGDKEEVCRSSDEYKEVGCGNEEEEEGGVPRRQRGV